MKAEKTEKSMAELVRFVVALAAYWPARVAESVFKACSASAIKSWQQAGEITHVTRQGKMGYRGDDILACAKRHGLTVELTEARKCLLDAKVEEYVRPDGHYDASEGSDDDELFGVSFGVVRKACRLNEIRRVDGVTCRPDRVEGAAFMKWAEATGQQLKPRPEDARFIYARRQRLATEAESAKQVTTPTKSAGAIDSMFDYIERNATEGEEFDRKLQAGATTAYRTLLPKRDAFESGDEVTLRSAIEVLKFAHEDVKDDASCLVEIDRQTKLATTVQAKRDAMAKAGQALKDLEARHKIEIQEARAAKQLAFKAQSEAAHAPARIRELQSQHPRLFGVL